MPNDGVTPQEIWQDQRADQDIHPIILALEKNPRERPPFQEIVHQSQNKSPLVSIPFINLD